MIEITVTGRGSHGAMPHHGIDPITAGAELVQNHEGLGLKLVDHLSTAQHLAGEGLVGGHHD